MLDESRFETAANNTLQHFAELMEPADAQGLLEAEQQGGVLTVTLENGRQYVISKHAPSRQIWLSSPISGGLHFSYNEDSDEWMLKDGRSLLTIFVGELKQMGVDIAL